MQDIPFDIPPGQPPLVIVEARADGKPVKMLLDTGNASPFDVLLTPEAAARIAGKKDAPPVPAQPIAPPAPGQPPAAFVIEPRPLRKFRLGPVRLRNATAGINPAMNIAAQHLGQPLDGIVGYKFMKGRTIAIDYRRHRVDLHATPPRREAIPFTLATAWPLSLVQVTINGKGPFQFALDTGASVTLVSRAVARAAELGPGETVNIASPGAAQAGGARLVQTRIGLGDTVRENRKVAITGSLAPLTIQAGTKIDGVLGADFFEGTRLTIDFRTNRLWVRTPKPAK